MPADRYRMVKEVPAAMTRSVSSTHFADHFANEDAKRQRKHSPRQNEHKTVHRLSPRPSPDGAIAAGDDISGRAVNVPPVFAGLLPYYQEASQWIRLSQYDLFAGARRRLTRDTSVS